MELLEGELLETRRIRQGWPPPALRRVRGRRAAPRRPRSRARKRDRPSRHQAGQPVHHARRAAQGPRLRLRADEVELPHRADGDGLSPRHPGFMSPEQAIGNRPQIDAQTDNLGGSVPRSSRSSRVSPCTRRERRRDARPPRRTSRPVSLATVTNGLNPRLVSSSIAPWRSTRRNRWPNARSMQFAARGGRKQTTGQVCARSIPDDTPTRTTRSRSSIPRALDAKGSWSSSGVDRTWCEAHVPADAIPSAITARYRHPAPARAHPADDDGPTLAVSSPTTTRAARGRRFTRKPPQTPHMACNRARAFARARDGRRGR